jgi:hypothetical protein
MGMSISVFQSETLELHGNDLSGDFDNIVHIRSLGTFLISLSPEFIFSNEQADHVSFSCILFVYIITEVLSVSGNFSGTLPSKLAGMKKLQYLDLNNCSLSGTIPSMFENMKELGMPCLAKFLICVQQSSLPCSLCHSFFNPFVLSAQGIFLWQIINLLVRSHLFLGNCQF